MSTTASFNRIVIGPSITKPCKRHPWVEKNVRCGKTSVRLLERSKIVLLAAKNTPNYKIAEALDIDVNKVGRWRSWREGNWFSFWRIATSRKVRNL